MPERQDFSSLAHLTLESDQISHPAYPYTGQKGTAVAEGYSYLVEGRILF